MYEDGLVSQNKYSEVGTSIGQPYRPTVRENLMQRKRVLEDQLVNVNAAIAAIDSNPGVEAVMDAVGKAL